MNVTLKNVRHGRQGILFALLVEAESGDLVISATLDYILKAIKSRGYILVA